jgi:hypothetical protein
MDFLDFTSLPAITVLCYLMPRQSKQQRLTQCAVICVYAGQILAVVAMHFMRNFRQVYITASAIGAMSGLVATGVNQVYKQLRKEL